MQADFDTPSNVTARSVPQTCICKDTKEQQHRGTKTNPLIHSLHRASSSRAFSSNCKRTKNKTKSSFTQSSQLKFGSCNKPTQFKLCLDILCCSQYWIYVIQDLSHLLQSLFTKAALLSSLQENIPGTSAAFL